jgi:hypothetical protein
MKRTATAVAPVRNPTQPIISVNSDQKKMLKK